MSGMVIRRRALIGGAAAAPAGCTFERCGWKRVADTMV